MQNSVYQGGHGSNAQPALPLHPQRRDFVPYAQQHPQHSPIPPYNGYQHPNPYYHAPQPRWQQGYQQGYQQHYMPPQQWMPPQHYAQRSPMIVSSQPHGQPMTPVTRQQHPNPPIPQSTQSPRPVPQYVHQQPPVASPSPAPVQSHTPAPSYTPAALPAPVPAVVPKPEERVETPPSPASRRQSIAPNPPNPLSLEPVTRIQYWPPRGLPWYSVDEERAVFPARATNRRRRRRHPRGGDTSVALPAFESTEKEASAPEEVPAPVAEKPQTPSAEELEPEPQSEASTIAAPSEPETPATSQAPSESEFTNVSTPATPAQAPSSSPKPTPTQQSVHARRDTRTIIAVPSIPGLAKPKDAASPRSFSQKEGQSQAGEDTTPKPEEQKSADSAEPAPVPEPVKAPESKPAPTSWAAIAKRNAPKGPAPAPGLQKSEVVTNGLQLPKSASLADVLKGYSVESGAKLNFLEPRGLVNTGNMCYMNSILQVLVFCVPFYNFLDQVAKRTVHSIKSETPLIDAMITFKEEFKPLATAESAHDIRSILKQEQLEQYGDSVTPDYVYKVIQSLPRFASMRRGHQQDAEEFLGFLLEVLHEECVKVMLGQVDQQSQTDGVSSPEGVKSPDSNGGWLEVGPNKKAVVTRTAGQKDDPSSPITNIFAGSLRAEFRVPGQKDSVTFEQYKPLQLDIGAQHVSNIIDALKGLTNTETLTGEFGGRGNTAKKQTFIDALPPVLIIHLKRFEYNNSTNTTQKIWKKVGYPLELQIPKEAISPAKRASLQLAGKTKYRLTSVVYHHGKSAQGGHYTVDVLRQDSREWIRMDDTIIRRIRPEDVAEGGSEEDPKVLAKALEQHKADQDMQKQRNMYQGLDEAEKEPEEEKPWSEVNGNVSGHKKNWSVVAASVTNGTATPTSTTGKRTPIAKKEGVRDNKVAYILLYERILD